MVIVIVGEENAVIATHSDSQADEISLDLYTEADEIKQITGKATVGEPDPTIADSSRLVKVLDSSTYSGTMELVSLQSRLAEHTQNTLVLNATGAGTITHRLGSMWYEITTTPTLTCTKKINTVQVSGGEPGERISYSMRLLIPENLNHLLTRASS